MTTTDDLYVEDGFGSGWEKCHEDCGLQVVRPGKVQCNCSFYIEEFSKILEGADPTGPQPSYDQIEACAQLAEQCQNRHDKMVQEELDELEARNDELLALVPFDKVGTPGRDSHPVM